MSAEFVDTNIFVYGHDSSSPRKQQISIQLIDRLSAARSGRLSTQVLLEFFSAMTRKLKLRPAIAVEILGDLTTWLVYAPSSEDVLEAARMSAKHSISIWDALIVQSALGSRCTTLWSEDLQHGRQFQTVVVRNPFLPE
jgi:predicted nucleic acid-binding protein